MNKEVEMAGGMNGIAPGLRGMPMLELALYATDALRVLSRFERHANLSQDFDTQL
jgi:hypothetical protein